MNYPDPEGFELACDRMGDDANPRWADDDADATEVDDWAEARAGMLEFLTEEQLAALPQDDDDAADGGEGDDMSEQMNGEDPGFPWESRLALVLDEATDLQLKQARYALEREEKRRLERAQATIRALDPNAPKPRATRSDAGRPRTPKAANDGERHAS